ncbi:hypothetical protein HUT06_37720 [Actinomadura sp. NAK00032]|uniref:hypothetical protein n=1 Tax=Actinomadura sp. NAK00032 TaxID=2742128 RepID=UPI00158FCAE7|nr:hypothetical protein [Actinomadura sp. NAK00032]QKW39057.1 hypothetical protein HUT06_37720 [Actinomadura sp. NAK00032]
MNNAARHGIGALAGVVATPLIVGCLAYSVDRLRLTVALGLNASLDGTSVPSDWTSFGVLLAGAVVIGLVVYARLSALASLIPGALMAAVGLLWVLEPRWMVDQSTPELVPEDFFMGYTNMAANGTFLLIGAALIVASVSPQRWRGARAEPSAPPAAEPPAPPVAKMPGPDDDVIAS